jgi:tetratricopeptide (TPR) repeat protein
MWKNLIEIVGICITIILFLLEIYARIRKRHDDFVQTRNRLEDAGYLFVSYAPFPKDRRVEYAVRFFQGFCEKELLISCASSGFCAERKAVEEIYKYLRGMRGRRFVHIHVYGGRQQGKSVVLALLAYKLAVELPRQARQRTLVLWCTDATKQTYKEAVLLTSYAQLAGPPRWLAWPLERLRLRRPIRVYIFVDDFLGPYEERNKNYGDYLEGLYKSEVTLITSAIEASLRDWHERMGTAHAYIEVAVGLRDEEIPLIIEKFNDLLPLARRIAPTTVIDELGGRRGFNNDLSTLMYYLLTKYAEQTPDFKKELTNLAQDPDIGEPLKYLAVSQVLELEVPRGLIGRCLNRQAPLLLDLRLVSNARGWVICRPLSYAGTQEPGLALRSRFLASLLLTEAYGVDARQFEVLVSNLLAAALQADPGPLEVEFVRHIFHKLSKGRYFYFPGVSGHALARRLYNLHHDLVERVIRRIEREGDVGSLCRWASTLARVGTTESLNWSKIIAEKALKMLEDTQTTLNSQDFVALTHAIEYDSALIRRGLQVLDVDRMVAEALGREEPWRINQIIHSYAELLAKIGDHEAALNIIKKFEHKVVLDPINLVEQASIQKAIDPNVADRLFQRAIEEAQTGPYRITAPTHIVKCYLEYAKFLCERDRFEDAIRFFDLAYRHAHPDFHGLEYEQVQNILVAWARCLKRRGYHRKALDKLEESIYYGERFQPPMLHWQTVQSLVNLWIRQGELQDLSKALSLLEQVLKDENLTAREHEQAWNAYARVILQWMQNENPLSPGFDNAYRSLSVVRPLHEEDRDKLIKKVDSILWQRIKTSYNARQFNQTAALLEHTLRGKRALLLLTNRACSQRATEACFKFATSEPASSPNVPRREERLTLAFNLFLDLVQKCPQNDRAWDGLVWTASKHFAPPLLAQRAREYVEEIVKNQNAYVARGRFLAARKRWTTGSLATYADLFERVFPAAWCRSLGL